MGDKANLTSFRIYCRMFNMYANDIVNESIQTLNLYQAVNNWTT